MGCGLGGGAVAPRPARVWIGVPREMLGPEVWATRARGVFRARPAPPGDLRMVAGEKNLRHGPALPFGGPRVVRLFEQAFRPVAFLDRARGGAHHPRQQPHAGI